MKRIKLSLASISVLSFFLFQTAVADMAGSVLDTVICPIEKSRISINDSLAKKATGERLFSALFKIKWLKCKNHNKNITDCPNSQKESIDIGSGILINSENILTAKHVIMNDNKLESIESGKTQFQLTMKADVDNDMIFYSYGDGSIKLGEGGDYAIIKIKDVDSTPLKKMFIYPDLNFGRLTGESGLRLLGYQIDSNIPEVAEFLPFNGNNNDPCNNDPMSGTTRVGSQNDSKNPKHGQSGSLMIDDYGTGYGVFKGVANETDPNSQKCWRYVPFSMGNFDFFESLLNSRGKNCAKDMSSLQEIKNKNSKINIYELNDLMRCNWAAATSLAKALHENLIPTDMNDPPQRLPILTFSHDKEAWFSSQTENLTKFINCTLGQGYAGGFSCKMNRDRCTEETSINSSNSYENEAILARVLNVAPRETLKLYNRSINTLNNTRLVNSEEYIRKISERSSFISENKKNLDKATIEALNDKDVLFLEKQPAINFYKSKTYSSLADRYLYLGEDEKAAMAAKLAVESMPSNSPSLKKEKDKMEINLQRVSREARPNDTTFLERIKRTDKQEALRVLRSRGTQ